MKILIKQFFLISFLTFLSSCNQQTTPDTTINKKGESSESNIRTECIIGERINGPANIRSRVNGDILFTLYDSTLISCTEPQNNWYAVGLSMEIPNSDLDNDTLRKGRKIIVDGKVVGEVLKDMYVSTSTDYKHSWAELTGYTHKDNVYPFSIIEKALSDYLAKANKRSMETFQPFIKSFQMGKSEGIKPFTTFFSYEIWIDDPSPLWRIELIFQENNLIGVVHSRPLQLPNTTDTKLNRGFRVAFFNETSKEAQRNFISYFNKYINTVD